MSRSSNVFTDVQVKKPQRNTFFLDHDNKLSCNMGRLVPILNMEIVPGDKIEIQESKLIRFQPMLAPIMHKVDVYTHYYFVPYRILWANWQKFITGADNGKVIPEAEMPVAPYFELDALETGTVGDYLGLPTRGEGEGAVKVSPLAVAAYAKIRNDYYMDQNLQDELNFELQDGNNTNLPDNNLFDLMINPPVKRAWEHDYFTSALPWPQKGDAVTMPLGTEADVQFRSTATQAGVPRQDGTPTFDGPIGTIGGLLVDDQNAPVTINNAANLVVDLSTATASTINDFRRAMQLQKFLELNARGGSKYNETILAHFGVHGSDKRLQRAEYFGGSKNPVVISEVLQTSGTDGATFTGEEGTPQGTMAGHAISVGKGRNMSYFAEEHGVIIGIMSIRPKTAYYQGLHKQWFKFDRLDYLWPTFAHIGEQEIKNKELFLTGDPDYDEGTFGYIPRYTEYRFKNSEVHGDFREEYDYWHMARKFSLEDAPRLNSDFVLSDPTDRIFAVQDTEEFQSDKLLCHVYFQIKAKRPLPRYGTPTM